ncbi:hypothetical protein KKF61_02945 [Patescibacteria group bacterium]|nr:hypothetical protein [Patescibacteria group bacterium]MBU0963985.1 hypothetical protein [Patescibacteria group bacterium]
MKNHQGAAASLIIIIVIVLVIAVGLVWYFVSQDQGVNTNANIAPVSNINIDTQATNSGWQTYYNNTFGYKLKFLKSWFYIADAMSGPPPPASAFFTNVQNTGGGSEYASITILVSSLSGETLDTWPEMLSLEDDGYARTDIKVDGEEAVRLEQNSLPSDNGGWIYVAKGDYIYRITWGAMTQAIFAATSDIMEQMINSFEFIPVLVPDFSQTGNMSKPAEEENWFLLWEEPGNPAITKELIFNGLDAISMCQSGISQANCVDAMANGIIDEGAVVTVEGILNPDDQSRVYVIKIIEI